MTNQIEIMIAVINVLIRCNAPPAKIERAFRRAETFADTIIAYRC